MAKLYCNKCGRKMKGGLLNHWGVCASCVGSKPVGVQPNFANSPKPHAPKVGPPPLMHPNTTTAKCQNCGATRIVVVGGSASFMPNYICPSCLLQTIQTMWGSNASHASWHWAHKPEPQSVEEAILMESKILCPVCILEDVGTYLTLECTGGNWEQHTREYILECEHCFHTFKATEIDSIIKDLLRLNNRVTLSKTKMIFRDERSMSDTPFEKIEIFILKEPE